MCRTRGDVTDGQDRQAAGCCRPIPVDVARRNPLPARMVFSSPQDQSAAIRRTPAEIAGLLLDKSE